MDNINPNMWNVIDILQKQFVFEQEMQRQENELHNINVDYEIIKP